MEDLVDCHDEHGNIHRIAKSKMVSRPGAFGFVRRGDSLLMTFDPRSGLHNLIGGGIDEGETAPEAMVREIREESGLIVDTMRPVASLQIHGWFAHHKVARTLQYEFFECFLVGGQDLDNLVTDEEFEIPTWRPIEGLLDEVYWWLKEPIQFYLERY